MKVDKRKKVISFIPSDKDEWEILLRHPRSGELMNLKVTYTSKGFGIQIFSERETDEEKGLLSAFAEKEYIGEFFYLGVWKLLKL